MGSKFKTKLETWGKVERESAPRPNSDWVNSTHIVFWRETKRHVLTRIISRDPS